MRAPAVVVQHMLRPVRAVVGLAGARHGRARPAQEGRMGTWDAEPDPDQERQVPGGELVLPDRLDPPLEAAEADVVDQAIEVPLGDEE